MATAGTPEQARPGSALPWEARLLLTLALLALYHFGHRLPLPLVNVSPEAGAEMMSRTNLLVFGFTSLFTGSPRRRRCWTVSRPSCAAACR